MTAVAADQLEKKPPSLLTRVWDLICEHWFILGLLGFGMGFAAAVPDFGRSGGWIAGQWTIKYGAVIVIFFLSGISLKTRALLTVLARLHLHMYIQFICLVLTPAIGYGIARALMESSLNQDLVHGLVVAMVMPTTISTNVVFTKQAAGNEAVALVNAVLGNIIGIFVSPAWLYLYLGKSGQAPYGDVIEQMAITIIAPLIVGQLVQYFFPEHVKKAQDKLNFGKIGNAMVILLVWHTFCNTFHNKVQLSAKSWVPMLLLDISIFLSFCAMSLSLATFVPLKRLLRLDKQDAVAVLMCGSTKTLALGMPLIAVLYGKAAHVGILSLPLLMYHVTQCLLGNVMIKHLRRWVTGPSPGAWPRSCWRGDAAETGGEEGADGAAAAAAGEKVLADAEAPADGKGPLDALGGAAGDSAGSSCVAEKPVLGTSDGPAGVGAESGSTSSNRSGDVNGNAAWEASGCEGGGLQQGGGGGLQQVVIAIR